MLRDFAVALSLANLCFFQAWAELLPGAYGHYFLKSPPSFAMHAGVLLSVLVSAFIFWLPVLLARRFSSRVGLGIARWAFLLLLIPVLNHIRHQLRPFMPGTVAQWGTAEWGSPESLLLKLTAVLLAFYALIVWHRRFARAASVLLLALAPFAILTFSQTAWAMVKIKRGLPFSDFSDKPAAPAHPVPESGRRVLWLLFDGLDQRLSFTERAPGLKLPNLDRFLQESFHGQNVATPAGTTLLSIPAMVTGRPIANARPARSDELMIQFSDSEKPEGWSTVPNVFSRAYEMGFNTAVVGYYHPYSRVLGNHLTACVWVTDWWTPVGMDDPNATVPEVMHHTIATMMNRMRDSLPLLWRFQPLQRTVESLGKREPAAKRRKEHIRNFLIVQNAAQKAAADPSLGLVLIHWPLPHHPYIYNRFNHQFDSEGESTYLDNLALVDRTLGELRQAMEEAGLWEKTTILLTTDHWLKTSGHPDRRVPFLLKLAGHREEVAYEPAFNTLVIHDLILDVLAGKISDPQGVGSWLGSIRSHQEK